MRTEDFDYQLPDELIAQKPVKTRDDSRLLIVSRPSGRVEHARFRHLPRYLSPGDALILNDTRVLPARLWGRKETGANVEVLLLRQLSDRQWETLVCPGRRLPVGTQLVFGDTLRGHVMDITEYGGRVVEFSWQGDWDLVLEEHGEVPLPPYITEPCASPERYQTIYAQHPGSVAAPTAGLHFTEQVLRTLRQGGVKLACVTLHVGLGTFRPVSVDKVEDHRMHEEFYIVSPTVARLLNQVRHEGGRWWAVGTTVTRVLETVTTEDGWCQPGQGWTEKFIYPPYRFKAVEGLLTNFHLPRSTLLMLVSALAGREKLLAAYGEAVRERYRFYSFGDAMLIRPEGDDEHSVQRNAYL